MTQHEPNPAAVLFDLDGTLTRPYFDFDNIRREIGLPTEPRTPILEALEHMGQEQRRRAEDILERHERRAADESELQPGVHEVLAAIRARDIPIGLLTRNSRICVDIVLAKHGLQFDAIHTREDGPPKPSPDPVLTLCHELSACPSCAWVVGDYLFDIQSGQAAGATTVLLVNHQQPTFEHHADHTIHALTELLPLLNINTK